MKRTLAVSIDQLYRRQPGGIATYVRGLVGGLALLGESLEVVGLAPRGEIAPSDQKLPITTTSVGLPLNLLTRLWPLVPLGVPRESMIVHATSMAGPFAGGTGDAIHSVAMHDLLWRDEPNATTRRGAKFHEGRLDLILRRDDLRVFTTSPLLANRLSSLGINSRRIHFVRLGVDDVVDPASGEEVRELLASFGVRGSFVLYAGTREPRKNLVRLIEAHKMATQRVRALGPLVLVGPEGWGSVATNDAVVLGPVERSMLRGLYREASVFAYVALAEGWGLPPVEALSMGARVVASSTTPSVQGNGEVVLVNPLDVESIAKGLTDALDQDVGDVGKKNRVQSVADLTWRNSALDHLEGWK